MTLLKVTNKSAHPTRVHSDAGVQTIEPNASVTAEFSDAERAQMATNGELTIEDAGKSATTKPATDLAPSAPTTKSEPVMSPALGSTKSDTASPKKAS